MNRSRFFSSQIFKPFSYWNISNCNLSEILRSVGVEHRKNIFQHEKDLAFTYFVVIKSYRSLSVCLLVRILNCVGIFGFIYNSYMLLIFTILCSVFEMKCIVFIVNLYWNQNNSVTPQFTGKNHSCCILMISWYLKQIEIDIYY